MAKTALTVLGIVFLLIGIWGYVQDPILGIFEVDSMHNAVHLLSGVLALIFAFMSEGAAKAFAKVFAVVYGLVAIMGLAGGETVLGMDMNGADDILHILLTIVFAYIGWSKRDTTSTI